jgi:D-glycero-D-manno-heptose 1,7-bisphosphate phosphatase
MVTPTVTVSSSSGGAARVPQVVFLDRDGVINRARADYVKSWPEFEFLPRALQALAELHRSRARVVVVTNQAAVGRGLLGLRELTSIHGKMLRRVEAAGGHIEEIYACPHTRETGCACRKPGTELFRRAAEDLGLRLLGAYVVGDSWTDVQAALSIGAMPILVAQDPPPIATENLVPVVHDLYEALSLVLPARRKPELAPR